MMKRLTPPLLALFCALLAAVSFAESGPTAPTGCYGTIAPTSLPSSGGDVGVELYCPNPSPYGIYARLYTPDGGVGAVYANGSMPAPPVLGGITYGFTIAANPTQTPQVKSFYWRVCDFTQYACVNTSTFSVTVAAASAQPPTGCVATATPANLPAGGGAVNLSVSCASGSGLTYSWTRNGVAASTSASWTDTLPANPGPSIRIYDYVATVCSGSACTTAGVSVSVAAPAQPPTGCVATATPANLPAGGGTVSLSVSCASGSGLTYSWTRNGVAASSSASFNDALPANAGPSARVYDYVATVCSGSLCTTAGVSVSVAAPSSPTGCVATASPASLPSSGGTVSLSVTCASGSGLTYSWTRNGVVVSSSAAFSDTLPGNADAPARIYDYVASVCSGAACATARTSVSVEGVEPSVTPTGCVVTLNGVAGNLRLTSDGGNVALAVSACSPSAGLTYNWRRNGAPNASTAPSWTDTPATNPLLGKNTGAQDQVSTYQVQVCSAGSCASFPASPATATVPGSGTPPPPGAAEAVSTGGTGFSALIRTDHTLWAWGDNTQKTLGDGRSTSRSVPVQVPGLMDIVAATVGTSYHTLALDRNGRVWAWGLNVWGEVGNGTQTQQTRPVMVPGITDVVAVAAGDFFSVALRNDGTVWAWGRNNVGQVGDGSGTTRLSPVQVPGLANVVSIAAAYSHAAATTADGSVYVWGSNLYVPQNQSTRPVVAPITNAARVFAGGDNTFVLRNDGSLWGWGSPAGGRLGDGGASNGLAPVKVMDGIALAFTGESVTMALGSDGKLWGWGQNEKGQLGLGHSSMVPKPVQLTLPSTGLARAAAGSSSFVVDGAGRTYSAGSNAFGALGTGDLVEARSPAPVAGLAGVKAVAASGNESVALRNDGSVVVWGTSDPNDAALSTPTPRAVPGLAGRFLAIAASSLNSAALREDGTVYGWGKNVPGAGANAVAISLANATPIPGLADVKAISNGGAGIVALTNAGRALIACTGAYPCPGTDFGFNDVVAVSAGQRHFLALRANGAVWAWGANDRGQLGNGTLVTPVSPVQVASLAGIARIAAGNDFSVAIATDGKAYAWGALPGTDTIRTVAARVAALDGARDIVASSHVIALDASGRAFTWGQGAKVGDRDRLAPAREPRMDGLAAIAAGSGHSLGVTPGGSVIAWGLNAYQQLGVSRQQTSASWVGVTDPSNPVHTKNAVPVVEFFNPAIVPGHHFVTAFAEEATALDNGTNVKGWQRTGRAWRAWLTQVAAAPGAKPVYRFFSSPANSHFYTAEAAEKDKLIANNPKNDPAVDWALEAIAFYAAPAASGCPSISVLPRSPYICTNGQPPAARDCPADYYPVYRAYNNGKGGKPNHRFTSNWIDTYRNVRFFGNVYEGVAFCAPASSQNGGDLQAYHTFPGNSVSAGATLGSDVYFANAGPGHADGALLVAAMPTDVNWTVKCTAYNGAACPGDLTAAALRIGVTAPALPAGGVIMLTATGQAPTAAQSLEFASAIGAPSGAPDPFLANNAAPVTQTVVKSAATCAVSATPATVALLRGGGSATVAVTAPAGCMWTVTADQPWAAVSPTTVIGDGTFTVTAGNNDTSERIATVSIAGTAQAAQVTVKQATEPVNGPCASATLSRTSDQIGANGMPNMFGVQVPTATCTWQATSDSWWAAITSATGQGTGQVEYSVQPHGDPSGERSATITISAGGKALQTFTIVQAPIGSAANQGDGSGGGGGGAGGGDGGGDGGGE